MGRLLGLWWWKIALNSIAAYAIFYWAAGLFDINSYGYEI
jgi:hypothetical protein